MAIEQLLVRFDVRWYRAFGDFVKENDDIKEGVASVYGVRNSVAHGGTGSVGLQRLKELFGVSQRLIDGLMKSTE